MKTAYEKAKDFFDTTNLRYSSSDVLKLEHLLKEQDRDTRHACAEACMIEEENQNYIVHKAFHDICMNCRGGIE